MVSLVVHGTRAQAAAPETRFDLPAQPLPMALNRLARAAGIEVTFLPSLVRGLQAPELHGDYTVDEALGRVLKGTGLTWRQALNGAYVVVNSVQRGAPPSEGVPEMGVSEVVVSGRRPWTLNTGIRRDENDTQPYIVFDRAQIEHSGADNLEGFLQENLLADTSANTAEQNAPGTSQGISSINLRGLGANETLILIDGRRVPGVSNHTDADNGYLGQAQVAAVPLASIERIEVLASSAAGIYGSNAAGGVINIILRRDYRGVEATATYGGTLDGGGASRRFDVAGGDSLEDGRTNLSFSASYGDSASLSLGQRGFYEAYLRRVLANDPSYFTTGPGEQDVLVGATPNIRSASGADLVLKNGASLGSPITYVPPGYPGVAVAGTGALVQDAGQYNLALAPGAAGAGQPLLLGLMTRSVDFSVKREFTPWLQLYAQVSGSDTQTELAGNRVPTTFTLLPSAPNNPFQQSIIVSSSPQSGDLNNYSRADSLGAVVGGIVKLPFGWQAFLDASWNREHYSALNDASPIDLATNLAILNGSIDILRDPRSFPVSYSYAAPYIGTAGEPSSSTGETLSFRVAGPVPLKLPGGAAIITLLAERDWTGLGGIKLITNATAVAAPPSGIGNAAQLTEADLQTEQGSSVAYAPPRSQTTTSGYGEIRLPIVAPSNRMPMVQSLDLQVAGRYDYYQERAQEQVLSSGFPLALVQCTDVVGTLQQSDVGAVCPPAGTMFKTGVSERGTFNPSVSLKWQIVPDIALRASYATGFLPPLLNELQRSPPLVLPTALFNLLGIPLFTVRDPLRGDEIIGSQTSTVSLTSGGNPDVLPETTTTDSFGAILTPRLIPHLRVSVDFTRIAQKNNYFSPSSLLESPLTPSVQAEFDAFLAANPARFTRGPASGGYTVGPITAIDASIANLTSSTTEALDYAFDYPWRLPGGWGQIKIEGRATYILDLDLQVAPGAAPVRLAGVGGGGLALATNLNGVRWKGNFGPTWTYGKLTAGARLRYIGPYYLDPNHSYIAPGQGSSQVRSQVYIDGFISYEILHNTTLRFTANNLFDWAPPFDVTNRFLYSSLGDPRLGSYLVSIRKSF